jgi:hypothetical protein
VLPAGSGLSAMCSNPAADWLGMFRPGSALHSRVFPAECSILCPSVAVCCLPPCLMPDTVASCRSPAPFLSQLPPALHRSRCVCPAG